MNRLVRVLISNILLHSWLSMGADGFRVLKGALPEDAVLVNAYFDGQNISLMYQSDSFDEVKNGDIPPVLDITLTRAIIFQYSIDDFGLHLDSEGNLIHYDFIEDIPGALP